jgi:hypothetical protein
MWFATPVGQALRAVSLEPSGFSADVFHVHVLFQVLAVPADHLVLSLGDRIRAPAGGWTLSDPEAATRLEHALSTGAAPFLESVSSLDGMHAEATRRARASDNQRAWEAAGVLALLRGADREALVDLQNAIDSSNPDQAWSREAAARAGSLMAFIRDDPAAARHLLEDRRLQTLRSLRISQYA